MNLARRIARHGPNSNRKKAVKKSTLNRRVLWSIEVNGRDFWFHATKGRKGSRQLWAAA